MSFLLEKGLLEKGEKYYNLGDYEEAIKCYDKALRVNANNTDVWKNKGLAFYKLGKYEDAIKCFHKAKGANICEVLEGKCISLLYIGKYEEAKNCADEAICTKCNGLALAIKAEALCYLGDPSNAIECADKAIDLSQNDKENASYAYFAKGYAHDYRGEHDKAIDCFKKAIDCDDKDVEAFIAKGIALNYKGIIDKDKKYYNKAEKCFDKAIDICKKNNGDRYQDIAYAYINKSTSVYNLGRNKEELDCCLTEALNYSNKSISMNPNDAHAWMIKGIYYFKIDFYDMAIECYNKIIMDINPEFDFAWCLKGYALNYLERYEEALKCFDKAIELNSEDPDYYMGKGISLHNLEKYDDAIKCFDEALHPDSAYRDTAYRDTVLFLKGASNYGKQWYIEASDDFKDMKDDINLNYQKHVNIGACYYNMGLVDKARKEYDKAEEARKEYDKAGKSDSNSVEFYYNLGVLNNDEGKTDIARKLFENCLESDRKFTKAREALEQLDSTSSTSEWFKWWFSNGMGKQTFGIALILSIFALIIFIVTVNIFILNVNQNIASKAANQNITQVLSLNQSTLSSAITGITILIGLLIVILLLPSIRRFKVGDIIELEPVPIDTKVQQHMKAIISRVKFGMQSF